MIQKRGDVTHLQRRPVILTPPILSANASGKSCNNEEQIPRKIHSQCYIFPDYQSRIELNWKNLKYNEGTDDKMVEE